MDVYSWFRRNLSKPQKTTTPSSANAHQINKQEPKEEEEEEEEEELFGVTDQLIDFIKTFTVETFKNFPLQDEEAANCDGGTSAGNVRKDLSEWQERHATLVLYKVKEMSQLRFRLCPGRMKEQQFWRIYFALVKSYTAEYELRAVQLARLRLMTNENETAPNTSAYEVEMSETKQSTSNLDSVTDDIESGKE